MNFIYKYKHWLAIILLQLFSSNSWADGNWEIATNCFNNQDYRCAFSEAKKLALDHRIVVGPSEMTTDSMTFYQMAMIEFLVDASFQEKVDAASFTASVFEKVNRRLPFSVELGILSAMHGTENALYAIKMSKLICDIAQETPPPSWRELKGVKHISTKASLYLQELLKVRPKC